MKKFLFSIVVIFTVLVSSFASAYEVTAKYRRSVNYEGRQGKEYEYSWKVNGIPAYQDVIWFGSSDARFGDTHFINTYWEHVLIRGFRYGYYAEGTIINHSKKHIKKLIITLYNTRQRRPDFHPLVNDGNDEVSFYFTNIPVGDHHSFSFEMPDAKCAFDGRYDCYKVDIEFGE